MQNVMLNLFDKIENKTGYIIIEHENNIRKSKKMHSSKGFINIIRALELTLRIQGRIHKNYSKRLFNM